MRKSLLILSIIATVLFAAGCKVDNGATDNPSTPTISLKEVEITANSYTFEITSNVAGEYGYVYVKEGFDLPEFQEWFSHNSGNITNKATVTIDGLSDNTNYILCVVLRSENGTYSAPQRITFTTPDDGIAEVITVENVTHESITFTINLTGNYIFMVVAQAELDYYNQTAEAYLKMFNVMGKDPKTYEWVDGGSYEAIYDMHVGADRDYHIVAAQCDSSKNITGDIHYAKCHTPAKPHSKATISTTLSDITSTSVKIKTAPDNDVSKYYVYVREKEWVDNIINTNGESMLATLVKFPSAGAWELTGNNERVWEGLMTNTDYYCLVLIIDNLDSEALFFEEFTTEKASSSAPEVNATITQPTENNHTTLNLNLYSETAASVRYTFFATADVNALRKRGYTDANIVSNNDYSMELSAEHVAAVKSTGFTIIKTDLWPDTEYTAIVSVKNAEYLETIKTVSLKTAKRPVPTRVESALFTSLLGEWEVSYDYIDYYGAAQRFSGERVTIAQGIDATTSKEYREQNQLVILGWPFQQGGFVDGGGYFNIDDLASNNSYWSENKTLAYRDYGPKVFLQIGAGDVVTMPTSLSTYLYNDKPHGGYTLYFFGCDYDNRFTAPATFPVTVSADGNTLVIGAHYAGAEFDNGVYRPAVFRNISEIRCAATSDIYLKRVK